MFTNQLALMTNVTRHKRRKILESFKTNNQRDWRRNIFIFLYF